MPVHLTKLKRERDKLKAKLASQKDFAKIQRERKELMKEIAALKNPRSTAFRKNVKRGLIKGGRSTLKYLDDITRPVPMRKRRRKK